MSRYVYYDSNMRDGIYDTYANKCVLKEFDNQFLYPHPPYERNRVMLGTRYMKVLNQEHDHYEFQLANYTGEFHYVI